VYPLAELWQPVLAPLALTFAGRIGPLVPGAATTLAALIIPGCFYLALLADLEHNCRTHNT
jgi:hypothetical protein